MDPKFDTRDYWSVIVWFDTTLTPIIRILSKNIQRLLNKLVDKNKIFRKIKKTNEQSLLEYVKIITAKNDFCSLFWLMCTPKMNIDQIIVVRNMFYRLITSDVWHTPTLTISMLRLLWSICHELLTYHEPILAKIQNKFINDDDIRFLQIRNTNKYSCVDAELSLAIIHVKPKWVEWCATNKNHYSKLLSLSSVIDFYKDELPNHETYKLCVLVWKSIPADERQKYLSNFPEKEIFARFDQ